jgi:hypothetical protein
MGQGDALHRFTILPTVHCRSSLHRSSLRYQPAVYRKALLCIPPEQVPVKLKRPSARLLRSARNDDTCHCEEPSDKAILTDLRKLIGTYSNEP